MRTFPQSFAFGTATSATQVEGGDVATDWHDFARQPGKVAHGDRPDVACDHWNRFREDVALQARLGVTLHRFSVEWARVEPEPGRFDQAVLERYREEVRALADAGIASMVTLHHFSFPRWLAAKGGALAKELPARFEAYTRAVARALGDSVELWVTLNEPNVLLAQGYVLGLWPPGLQAPHLVPRAVKNLKRAHRLAYAALHELVPNAKVGIAHALRPAVPATRGLGDRLAAALLDRGFNRLFLDLPQDWLGVNYYTRDLVRFAPGRPKDLFMDRSVPPGVETNDLGWELFPEGLGLVLRSLAPRRLPIYITENGIADAEDSRRARFLDAHLAQVLDALADGVDVRGYLHWSLLDNFEWADGYAPRFGLYAVDYATQVRTLRKSGERYAHIIRTRTLE